MSCKLQVLIYTTTHSSKRVKNTEFNFHHKQSRSIICAFPEFVDFRSSCRFIWIKEVPATDLLFRTTEVVLQPVTFDYLFVLNKYRPRDCHTRPSNDVICACVRLLLVSCLSLCNTIWRVESVMAVVER